MSTRDDSATVRYMRWLVASLVFCAAACGKSPVDEAPASAARPSASVAAISIAELERAIAEREVRAVDANTRATRVRLGTIPGALLLSDNEVFALSELPPDKTQGLVFYCANEHCSASDEAAGRAVAAGYTNVRVLAEGIAGWRRAGKRTDAQPIKSI